MKLFAGILLLFFPILLTAGDLNSKVTYSCTGTSLIQVLQDLENLTGTTFSFKSNTINQNRPISVSFSATTLEDALYEILIDEQVKFAAVGSQIIIMPDAGKKPEPERPKVTQQTFAKIVRVYDTVHIIDTVAYIDTVRIFDTLTHYDTIVYTDTIKSLDAPEQETVQPSRTHFIGIEAACVFQNNDISRTTYESDSLSYVKENYTTAIEQSAGIRAGIRSGKISISIGIGATAYKQTYNAKAVIQKSKSTEVEEPYTEITLDSSCIVQNGKDTAWFPFSKALEKTRTKTVLTSWQDTVTRNATNAYTYLTLPIVATYQAFSVADRHFVNAGFRFQTSILLNHNGSVLNSKGEITDIPQRLINNMRFSYGPLVCYEFKATDNIRLGASYHPMLQYLPNNTSATKENIAHSLHTHIVFDI